MCASHTVVDVGICYLVHKPTVLQCHAAGGTADGAGSIDPSKLPIDRHCNPVYPHQFVQTNTIFEVMELAWGVGVVPGMKATHVCGLSPCRGLWAEASRL